ncbi:hypothetical protein [Dawidia soli]|uniref:Uncharacterized protein n=1 Tax=Dawidia soli TaxID=2782352 RepID=A0AAP2D9T8_9BACT|nr:hypothetical protein [Dawidia soli]MBT1688036.1 hypothetical protein [Dawidia soli]
MAHPRMIIFPKDIQLIIGLGYRASVRLHKKISMSLGKASHQYLTTHEFCEFMGLDLKRVELMLNQT